MEGRLVDGVNEQRCCDNSLKDVFFSPSEVSMGSPPLPELPGEERGGNG